MNAVFLTDFRPELYIELIIPRPFHAIRDIVSHCQTVASRNFQMLPLKSGATEALSSIRYGAVVPDSK